ncbi:MAG: 16S rRNA processing protein RimM [Odoribacteraceae bacterium]|jgi:16S rRNA processing protein RimM|nr:16S rRNA processing protein RimM [Odoribacteraceae bacterium]
MTDERESVKIGTILRPHHLQGAMIVQSRNDLLSLPPNEPVFILLDGAPVPFYIAPGGISRRGASSYLVKFDYVDSVRQAERLAGRDLLGDEEEACEEEEQEQEDLAPGIPDMVGFAVQDLLTRETGEVIHAANYSGNIVLTVRLASCEILVPLSGPYVKEIRLEERLLHVEIPAGLRELNER